jgi:hypothetical protein
MKRVPLDTALGTLDPNRKCFFLFLLLLLAKNYKKKNDAGMSMSMSNE